MGAQYSQLTQEERYYIYQQKDKASYTEIGKAIGKHRTSIQREINRNSGLKGYRYQQAQGQAEQRHREKNKAIKLTKVLKRYSTIALKKGWNPETICGRLFHLRGIKLHFETIYQWLKKDQDGGGELYKSLRFYGRPYKKRYRKSKASASKIPNRVDISERPDYIDAKENIGDWEADTVIGKGHKGGFATIAERVSRIYLSMPIARKTAKEVNNALIKALSPIKNFVNTITFDNGMEFCQHEVISTVIDSDHYFARPYRSCDRGLNEQSNGLLRKYFPKNMELHNVSLSQTIKVVNLINLRPRKCLGYKTPVEVFKELTGVTLIFNSDGALMT